MRNAQFQAMIDAIYPVGICVPFGNSTDPNVVFGSTWKKVAEGRTLQGADSNHAAGSTVNAGLPNITGNIYSFCSGGARLENGALFGINEEHCSLDGTLGDLNWKHLYFDASKSNNIYGASNTVQPPAYIVVWWQRTA